MQASLRPQADSFLRPSLLVRRWLEIRISAAFIKLLPNAIFYPGDQAAWPAVKNNLQNTVGTALVGNVSNVKKVLDGLQKKADAAAKKS